MSKLECLSIASVPPRAHKHAFLTSSPCHINILTLLTHMPSFFAFSEDSKGHQESLQKLCNWTHPGEFFCNYCCVGVGFHHRLCLDMLDSHWRNPVKETIWCYEVVFGTTIICFSWLAGKECWIMNSNKKENTEAEEEGGEQTTQPCRQITSPEKPICCQRGNVSLWIPLSPQITVK